MSHRRPTSLCLRHTCVPTLLLLLESLPSYLQTVEAGVDLSEEDRLIIEMQRAFLASAVAGIPSPISLPEETASLRAKHEADYLALRPLVAGHADEGRTVLEALYRFLDDALNTNVANPVMSVSDDHRMQLCRLVQFYLFELTMQADALSA